MLKQFEQKDKKKNFPFFSSPLLVKIYCKK